jgi:hypothetical protein
MRILSRPPGHCFFVVPGLFLYRKVLRIFLYKKHSVRDRTAAQRYYVAEATRRRRRILQSRILFISILGGHARNNSQEKENEYADVISGTGIEEE